MYLLARVFTILALVMAITSAGGRPAAATGAANATTVLILSTTVVGGASSQEALAAIAAGMSVEMATPAQWALKTAADFATYRALILGDPNCVGYDPPPFAGATSAIGPAIANASVWGPAVTGKAILIGTDVRFHNKTLLAQKGIAFAVSEPGKTGAYITLSCYYHEASAGTPLSVMDGFSLGGFTVTGVGTCFNDVHIVATHPALTGLTDAYLSNWNCSVHEGIDRWPVDWQVLAIAKTGSAYTAPDGTTGIPYILARGVEVISDIKLTPLTGTVELGTSYTLTATVKQDGVPAAGKVVTFTAIAGPNTGLVIPGAGPTDAAGQTTASYTSAATGTDTWKATFLDSLSRTQTSNTATVTWTVVSNRPPTANAGGPYTVPEGGSVVLSGSGTDPDAGQTLSYSWDLDNNGTFETSGQSVTFSASTLDGPSSATVVLKVCDSGTPSMCTTSSTTIAITNVAPTANAGPDQTQYWGLGLYFVGSATDPSAADTSAGFTGAWNFGDGGTAATMAASHTYALPGGYTASFTATDKDGGTSAPDTAQVTILRRATALSCTSISSIFGFPTTMSAQLSDRVNSTTAILAGHVITFIVDGVAAGSGVTDATGVATATSPALATPGSHTVSATFAGDLLYTSSTSTACSVSVSNSVGKVTWGNMRSSNNGRGGGNANSDGTSVTGEVQFQNDSITLHAHTVTAVGISPDRTKAWISATGTNGEAVLIYVEDNGEPGRNDIFRIWVNGTSQNGDGAITGGNVQIHK